MEKHSENLDKMRDRIRHMLKKNRAILLAHNYQRPEVQDIADLCGDSLELSIRASETDAEVIVFCGVHFMAETASILCPDKKVILPVANAGCPMADMITAEDVKKRRRDMEGTVVISYVNTTADVKAESDMSCTSANSVTIAESVEPPAPIFMLPDRNLAMYTASKTDRQIRFHDGYCPIHDRLTPEQVSRVRAEHPEALFLAHPECRPEVLGLADEITSTSGMIRAASMSGHREFIIGTEAGILHPLARACPEKTFIPASPDMICEDMKKTGLKEILTSLESLEPEIKVPEETRVRAEKAVRRMLEVKRERA